MAALPNISIGPARPVEREALSDFLRRLNESDNPAETSLSRSHRGTALRCRRPERPGDAPEFGRHPRLAVLERPPVAQLPHARGSHIYIRPCGEHRFTMLDDLYEASLAQPIYQRHKESEHGPRRSIGSR